MDRPNVSGASASRKSVEEASGTCSAPLLDVRDLRVTYRTYAGDVQSVRGVSFTVGAGESVAIVGESGCGKSVTAKAIMGLIKEPGELGAGSAILFDGVDTATFSPERWRRYKGGDASIVFQEALTALDPTMRVGKQVREGLLAHSTLSKREADERVIQILGEVGIPEPARRARQFPHELSGGLRQRAMIAAAIACTPRLLICDEPTTALDVSIQDQILALIRKIRDENRTAVIMITHDMGVVADIAERILVMYAGVIVERGSASDVFERPRHPYTRALLDSMPHLTTERGGRLASIPGAPPDLIEPPMGCPFAGRCGHAMPVCRRYMPQASDFGGGHLAACWLHDERAPRDAPELQEGEAHER